MARHALLSLALLVMGCEAWSAGPDAREPLEASCAALEGSWAVRPLEVRAYGDPDQVETIDLTLTIYPDEERFTAVIERDGQRIRQSGGLVAFDDQVVLSDPLVPGVEAGTLVLECGYDGRVLRLAGDASYHFADAEPDEAEPAELHLEATPLP